MKLVVQGMNHALSPVEIDLMTVPILRMWQFSVLPPVLPVLTADLLKLVSSIMAPGGKHLCMFRLCIH